MRRGFDADGEALRGGMQLGGRGDDRIGGEIESGAFEALGAFRLRNYGKRGRRHLKPRMEDASRGFFEDESQEALGID